MRRWFRPFCLAALIVAAPASAQDNVMFKNIAGDFAMISMLHSNMERNLGIDRSEASRTPEREALPSRRAEAPQFDASILSFKPSPTLRRRNYQQFVDRSRAQDPAGAAGLAETLASDPVAQMAPELGRYGLRIDNVADAYTVYWIEAWEAAHRVSSNSSREIAQAVRKQAADGILATPGFATASDAQKQELADAFLVQALLIAATREQNKADPAALAQIAAAVRQGASATGLDLDAFTLTEQGFALASR